MFSKAAWSALILAVPMAAAIAAAFVLQHLLRCLFSLLLLAFRDTCLVQVVPNLIHSCHAPNKNAQRGMLWQVRNCFRNCLRTSLALSTTAASMACGAPPIFQAMVLQFRHTNLVNFQPKGNDPSHQQDISAELPNAIADGQHSRALPMPSCDPRRGSKLVPPPVTRYTYDDKFSGHRRWPRNHPLSEGRAK